MNKSNAPGVIFQPNTYQGMQRGINQLVSAIRPTLGPLSRTVAIDQVFTKKPPEVLHSGGIIARRIIEVKGRDEDMGAMLARAMICRLEEQVGDGTATAAVLFQSIYDQGIHYITSGGDAMRLRQHLNQALPMIVSELDRMTVSIEGKKNLTHLAASLGADPALAKMMGEIFDIIGEYGQLDIRTGRSQKLEREYIEGMYWENSGVISREMILDRTRLRSDFENAAILITDLEVDEPHDLLPIVELATKAEIPTVIVLVRSLAEPVIATFLLANRNPEKLRLIAVKTPGENATDRSAAIEDLVVLTGGTPLLAGAGDTLRSVRLEKLGWARRSWATLTNFGIVGGAGDARQLRQHLADLKKRLAAAEGVEARRKVQQRIGKLMGGSASLWVGGATEGEITVRQAVAQRIADSLRGAILEGVLPGGAVSLLACLPLLEHKMKGSTDPDERAAYHILLKALREPAFTIIQNAGYNAEEYLVHIKLAGGCAGLNVLSGQLVDMVEAGIFDVAGVLKKSLHSAVSTAALALTVDVLVHHKQREEVSDPG